MRPKPAIQPFRSDTGTPRAPIAREPLALQAIAVAGFLLLAIAICMRPLFRERWTVVVPEVLVSPPSWWAASPAIMYLAHLLAAAGAALGALWVVLTRRTWRVSGLEIGAAALTAAALLALPHVSDKRMAINAAIGTILPLLGAAVLYQLLADRPLWRRVLLAALVGMAAANAWKSTAQHSWEADQALRDYQQHKEAIWANLGRSADDPLAQMDEARLQGKQPEGYFFHPNVMASFLLLGIAATGAGLAGTILVAAGRWRNNPGQPKPDPAASSPARLAAPPIAVATLLAGLIAWLLVVVGWVGSAGAMAGLATALLAGGAAWFWRKRPRTLAIVLVSGLALLQGSILVLALRSGDLYHGLEARGGKVKSVAVRLNYWQGAVRMFQEHPLVGVGPAQFGKYYTAFKPPYASEDVAHPHDWLLNQAAEWGLIGVIGLLVALAGPGWRILRSLAQSTASSTRTGQVILLAGLVGFLVHAMVEMASGVPAATWPFWTMLVLTMTWTAEAPDSTALPALKRVRRRAALPIAMVAVAVVAAALTIRPLCSIDSIDQARQQIQAQQPEQAVQLLRAAAAADPLDPAPLKIAGLLRQQMGRTDPPHAQQHLAEAVALFRTAAQRDPASYMVWRNLALADMYLATQVNDFAHVRDAVEAMQQALVLYPNWPAGWLELAGMAGIQSDTLPDQPALLRIALAALDKAQTLDDLWPADDARKFKPRERSQMQQMRQQFRQRLQAREAARSAAQPQG